MHTYHLSSRRHKGIFTSRVPQDVAERWIEAPQGLTSPLGRGAPCRRRGPIAWEGLECFVKRHRGRRLKALAGALVGRSSPARRGFLVGLRLEEARVPAPRVWASIESRFPGESILVTELVPGRDLRAYLEWRLKRSGEALEGERVKESLWGALGQALARLHAACVVQRDLKAPNILVLDGAPGPQVTLVDLEGMRYLGRLPPRALRARDLGRLAASLRADPLRARGVGPADWERIILQYLEAARAAFPREEDPGWWLEATIRRAEEKEAHNRRRGRPVY